MNLKDLMKDYFLDLDAAGKDPHQKIAWCTSAGPAEILRAFGFKVYFPENHGAMLGATRTCMDTIPTANAYGYSPDICSYLTCDIGAHLKGFTPLTRAYGIQAPPKPDVLVYNTNQCKEVMHWFEFYAREFKAPVFGIHSPNLLPEIADSHIDTVYRQFKALIAMLEGICNKKLDLDNLKKTVKLSWEASGLWSEVLSHLKHKPSPLNFFDTTVLMGPIVMLRGTEQAKEFYSFLNLAVQEMIASETSSIPNEKKRIYWDGMPVWGRLKFMAELFKKNHTCIVASTYCNSWIYKDHDAADPLLSMAKNYLDIFINRNDAFKEKYIFDTVKDFAADGVIFHDSKTCPHNTNSQFNMPNRLREKGLPSLVINGDLCDLRCFSDEQSTTAIEAFLETL
ncbi:MAG: 2-hydroxyacyl-CoA dehydratase [Deltaproteobacteria bacterium]|nr:2-hydroxyacyl-CoA dehydratase [Deltaproteobacteria bacterium]